MKKRILWLGLSFLLVTALVLTSCAEAVPGEQEEEEEEEEEITPTPAEEEVNFRLWISDEANAITDFDELWVTISDVGMVQADGNGLIKEPLDWPAVVDLTKLEGDNATEIWSGELNDGTYTKVFIYVTNVAGTLKNGDGNGELADVKLPSNKLQISKPFTISSENGQVVDFVFDITVIEAGKSGKYNLLPQIAQSGPDQDINDVDLKITTTTLLGGEEGAAYTDTVVATGGTGSYTWSISEGDLLPDGLTLDSGTGVISGTPTTEGEYEFTVQVDDESDPVPQSDTQELSINITTAGVVLDITTTTLSGGEVGTAYTATALVAIGGTGSYTWSVLTGSLPDELELDDDTGEISGTLATGTAGDYTFTVQVEDDSAQTDTQELSINITTAGVVLDITTTTLLGGEIGAAYTDTVVATGGTGSYTWSVLTGSLPDELELDDDTGEISGTLATGTAGDYTFTIQVEDDSAQTDTQELSILIEA